MLIKKSFNKSSSGCNHVLAARYISNKCYLLNALDLYRLIYFTLNRVNCKWSYIGLFHSG